MTGTTRVWEATDPAQLMRARQVLEAEDIPYLVEGEHYSTAAGGWAFGGDAAVWVQVPAEFAAHARRVLDEI